MLALLVDNNVCTVFSARKQALTLFMCDNSSNPSMYGREIVPQVIWVLFEDEAYPKPVAEVLEKSGLANFAHVFNPEAPKTLG